jgi:hypothetical protein
MSKFLCEYCDEMCEEIDDYCLANHNIKLCEGCSMYNNVDDRCHEIRLEKKITILEKENEKLKESANKWDKLVNWLKISKNDEDCEEFGNIWDFLGDELGISPNGRENE